MISRHIITNLTGKVGDSIEMVKEITEDITKSDLKEIEKYDKLFEGWY